MYWCFSAYWKKRRQENNDRNSIYSYDKRNIVMFLEKMNLLLLSSHTGFNLLGCSQALIFKVDIFGVFMNKIANLFQIW